MPPPSRPHVPSPERDETVDARINEYRSSLTRERLAETPVDHRIAQVRIALSRLQNLQNNHPNHPAIRADIAAHGKVPVDPAPIQALISNLTEGLPMNRPAGIAAPDTVASQRVPQIYPSDVSPTNRIPPPEPTQVTRSKNPAPAVSATISVDPPRRPVALAQPETGFTPPGILTAPSLETQKADYLSLIKSADLHLETDYTVLLKGAFQGRRARLRPHTDEFFASAVFKNHRPGTVVVNIVRPGTQQTDTFALLPTELKLGWSEPESTTNSRRTFDS